MTKILAPAGDIYSFFAAVAAGADAVYCGLKNFSARMEAKNFSMDELSRLNALARSHNVELHVAFNSLVKQTEIEKSARVIAKLAKYVRPHALILQDPGLVDVARQCGFKGDIHLSTLANCSFPMGLEAARKAGFSSVVLPRELTIDEIKMMASDAPSDIDLEIFIHGALCYAVSGRCYWSSWFGGRSGLRGRCVQPCRRIYKQKKGAGANSSERYFSCLDFSADVLVKVLKDIPQVTTWKIEGRKKSPHYVFYTVKAYKMLRDHGHDPQKKKIALSFLEYAMGRPATHYNLLSQRPQNPLKKDMETGSGLFAGRVKLGDNSYLVTREALLKDDLLRIGYEDDSFHSVQRVNRSVPKKGTFVLKGSKGGKFRKGTPVFIVDRREKDVWELIKGLENEFEKFSSPDIRPQNVVMTRPFDSGADMQGKKNFRSGTQEKLSPVGGGNAGAISLSQKERKYNALSIDLTLFGFGQESRVKSKKKPGHAFALWLSSASVKRCSPSKIKDIWWFLPPVIWPENQNDLLKTIGDVISAGARNFVLNMLWQIPLFEYLHNIQKGCGKSMGAGKEYQLSQFNLWAGPFCNIANSCSIDFLKQTGFSGAFVSPEPGGMDILSLPSMVDFPLGVLVEGNWPLAISRIASEDIELDRPFKSPKGEDAWVTKKEHDFWVYPNWILDLSANKEKLEQAGYELFLKIEETVPKNLNMKKRQGMWNWELGLL
ncbi:Peptidase (U32 family protein) [Desulfamplus magnetovallimortis]|uniref:Peptidase (U32 family protein) n=1 Tax=Desulfamplus magnetovallimortis TaxID=1246637 RepID=A0A1W1H8W1_9BACT|nr:U32 family peptidase [Desulfamplus magnetovallimortis]SLM28930.1 Peptidase (U32 family protein) [Desulfamplus magnetovallimortis]